MHALIINGSPRIKKFSNTDNILDEFVKGMCEGGNTCDRYEISDKASWDEIRKAYDESDNILIARESLFYTFLDYYEAFCRDVLGHEGKLQISTLRTIAYIISWNIWQMDGITKTLPLSGEHEQAEIERQQFSLFDDNSEAETVSSANEIQKKTIYAKVAEWSKDGEANRKVNQFKDII